MKQYSIEIFDQTITYKSNSVIDSFDYKYDYLDPEKVKVDLLPDVVVGVGDYIHIFNDDERYIGIVEQIKEQDDGIKEVTYIDIMSLFDVQMVVDVQYMTGNLEQYIANRITEQYINNSDSLMNKPLTVSTTSQTSDWSIEAETMSDNTTLAEINLFDDIILPAFTSYGIAITTSINLNNKRINLSIGKNTSDTKYIEADLPNVISKNIVINQIKKQINKVIVFNQDNYSNTLTYYLHPNGSFDTNNTNRLSPVEYEYAQAKEETKREGETEIVIPFSDNARDKANAIFEKNKYDNLIELEILPDDELINPGALKIGQEVMVLSDGIFYSSIYTGIERRDITKLIFGTIRLELTKILKGRA